MLFEYLTYFSTSCPGYVRQMGYLKEAIAIMSRYKRCSKNWTSHLENTKSAILAKVQMCEEKQKAVILGSGLLLDLPIERLADVFREVVLVDIVHLRPAIKIARRFENVRMVSCDVTGIAEKMFSGTTNILPIPNTALPEVDNKTDLVVSLNILSQLPVVLTHYAINKMPGLDENSLKTWERRIIKNHYEALKSTAGAACLITDCETVCKDKAGVVVKKFSSIADFRLPEPDKSWIWDIAPYGEEYDGLSVHNKVAAVYL